jgi:hypothetical protein
MPSDEVEPRLRFGFVEMLFALTAAEIAIQASDLVKYLGIDTAVLPAYTHLLVATTLVTTSWVGWLKSKAPGNRLDVEAVFSWPFVVLLLDVFLVVCYFIVVRGLDAKGSGDSIVRAAPSAANETFWLMVVFAGYFLWDVLTKALIGYADEQQKTLLQRLQSRRFWKRAWVSAACLLVSIVMWQLMRGFTRTWSVVAADGALIAVILLFRALKQNSRKWTAGTLVLAVAGTVVGICLNA